MNYAKLGKHERKSRRAEYQTALGILQVVRDHAENGDLNKIKTFVEFWDQEYTNWLEQLDQAEQELKRRELI